MHIHNFWRSLEQWKALIQYKNNYDEFCGVCFEPKCDCNKEKISYQDALDELSYWAEINIMEAQNSGKGFVQDNQGYDRDHVYPFLPPITEGKVEGVNIRFPQDVPLVAIIVRGTRQWFYDGQSKLMDEVTLPQGITWGVIIDDFHPIARYNYPFWHVNKEPLPYGLSVIITDRVPNYEMKIVRV